MRREGQRFILEVNGFDGSNVSPFVRGADESQCQRATRILLLDGQGGPLLTRVIDL